MLLQLTSQPPIWIEADDRVVIVLDIIKIKEVRYQDYLCSDISSRSVHNVIECCTIMFLNIACANCKLLILSC